MFSKLLLLRSAPPPVTRTVFRIARPFHASASTFVKVGDLIPDIDVMEDSPGNRISISKELRGKKAILLGVPAAFSPGCSSSHLPGYISAKRNIPIYVIAANDAFVTKAWGELLTGGKAAGIRFLADPTLKLINALDLAFDGTAIFGGPRSKRYALIVEDGKVLKAFIEPDNTGVKVSTAENVLKEW